MQIGEIVVFIEDFTFNNKVYKKGHQFKIVGEDGFRGFDLMDKDGNKIYETRFISDKYISLSDFRNIKLNDLEI